MKNKIKRYRNILIITVIITFFTLNMFTSIKNVSAKEMDLNLGNLSHYNGVIFGNANVNDSRVEGALAVGGNINISSSSSKKFEICASASKGASVESSLVGSKYIEDEAPSLLLGGNVIKEYPTNNDLLVWSKPVVTSNNISSETKSMLSDTADGNNLKEISQKAIESNFSNLKNSTNDFINNIKSLNIDNKEVAKLKFHKSGEKSYYTEVDINNIINSKNKNDIKGLYCNLSSNSNTLNISELHLPDVIGSAKKDNVKYLVLYSDAKTINIGNGGFFYNKEFLSNPSDESNNMITFHNGNDTLKKLAEKIVWVLPNATKVNTDGGVIGTVMAPNATLQTNGGDIVGQVIINNFNQENGGNFCSYLFDWSNWPKVVENNVENKTNSGEFNLKKTAEYYHKGDKTQQLNDREYTIKLNAAFKGMTKPNPKDVVLVLDKSGSMLDNNAEEHLKEAAENFCEKLLNNQDNKISIITFSQGYNVVQDVYDFDSNWEKGEVNYYGNNSTVPIYIDKERLTNNEIKQYNLNDNYNYYWGYIYSKNDNPKRVLLRYHHGRYVMQSGMPSDSELLVDFTSNKKEIVNKINDISAGGGTDAESALDKVSTQLQKVKDDKRGKYVIFFTDGLPNVAINSNSNNDNDIVDQTISTYKKIEEENNDTKFISLGFKSSTLNTSGNSYLKKISEKFLSSIQNYNKEIDPDCTNGVIYIDTVDDINKVYNKIYEKIINTVNNVTIKDVVPDNFEIVKDSISDGGIIHGNTVIWNNQTITNTNQEYSFRIKAKDIYFGNVKNDTDYMNIEGKINTNEKATIEYVNPADDKNNIEEFPVPKVNVPNEYNLRLIDKTVLYGDKIKLKDLIKDLTIKYGPVNGYVYTWTDDKGNKIILNNQNINEKSGDGFGENDSIVMKDDTNYTLEITNKNIPSFDLKSTGKINVIKPQIDIIKKVIDLNGNNINSNQLFSFSISQNYGGNIPVEVINQKWNADIYNNKDFIINNVTRGKYNFNERDSQEYNIKSIIVNGKSIPINKNTFEISTSDNYVTVNGEKIDSNIPVIKINVVNIYNPLKFFNSSNVIRNTFEQCK